MKVVTLQQLEADFDAILEDVEVNKEFYRVQSEAGDVMLIPYNEYVVLRETYQEWVDHPQIDPFPLPVEYIADAEPEKI
jgi:PHD/YefM family antitoxin component YafN of YafNO toxin-antitoxin module